MIALECRFVFSDEVRKEMDWIYMKLVESKGGRKIFSRVSVRLRQPGESRSRERDPIDLKVDGLGSRKDGGSRVPKRSNTDLLSALAL